MSPLGSFTAFVRAIGVTLTAGQRALCAACFDGADPIDLPPADRDLARRLFGDVDRIPPAARHVVAILAGARSGKSYLAALRVLHLALTVPLETLAHGEAASAILVAPDLRLARLALRYAAGAARARPELAAMISSETADAITLARPDGTVTIECLPATRGGSALRGRSLVGAALDEAAFFRGDDSVVNDDEVYKALAPRVMAGGQIIVASTPWGESGLLHDLIKENHGRPTTAIAAHGPTAILRDDAVTLGQIARERKRDPLNAMREFDAVPMAPESSLFTSVDLARVTRESPAELRRSLSFRYVAAIDPATRGNSFTLAILEIRDPLAVPRYAVAMVRQWTGSRTEPLDLERTIADVAATCSRYGVTTAYSDQFSADALVALAKRHGLTIRSEAVTAASKLDMFESLRTRIATGELQLSPDPVLRADLLSVTKRVTQSGIAIVLPRTGDGRHADYAPALALAVKHAPRAAANAAVRSRVQITGASYDETPLGWDGPPSADGTIPEPAIAQALANALGLGH